MEMTDLGAFDTKAQAAKGADMQLRSPYNREPLTRAGKAVTIRLLGTDGEKASTAQHVNAERRLDNRLLRPTAEILEDESLSVLVACTVGWANLYPAGSDKPLEFSEAAARKLYKDFPWIYEQAIAFINDRANFSKA